MDSRRPGTPARQGSSTFPGPRCPWPRRSRCCRSSFGPEAGRQVVRRSRFPARIERVRLRGHVLKVYDADGWVMSAIRQWRGVRCDLLRAMCRAGSVRASAGLVGPRVLALAVLVGVMLLPSEGRAAWLSESELERTFSGQTLVGSYVDGINFRDAYAADGNVAYQDERVSWQGEWYVAAGLFCTFYNERQNGGCFRVRRLSQNCYAFFGTDQRPERPCGTDRGRDAVHQSGRCGRWPGRSVGPVAG